MYDEKFNISFGNNNFRPTFPIHDANGDGYITEYDFTLMAQQNGWGQAGIEVAISAFRQLDRNRNGILDKEDVILAFGYMDRLYNDNYFPPSVTSLEPKQQTYYYQSNNYILRPSPNLTLTPSGPPFDNSIVRPVENITVNIGRTSSEMVNFEIPRDYDKDGRITEADFLQMYKEKGWKNAGEDVARSAFRKIDKNRNGYLERDDMNRAFGLMDRLYNDNYNLRSVEQKQPNYCDQLNVNMTRPSPNLLPPFDKPSRSVINISPSKIPNFEIPPDYDRDGRITEDDFIIIYKEKGWKNAGEDVARSAFRKIDKNRNGNLDREDMNRAFGLMDRLYNEE